MVKEVVPVAVKPDISPSISKNNINNHEKPYQCNVCYKQFTKKKYLIKHQRIHNNEKPFKCDVCGKQFSQRENLVRHQRIHNN